MAGSLQKFLGECVENSVYLVGTSANYRGDPTIIDLKEFEKFAREISQLVDCFIIDTVEAGEGRSQIGIDSMSIFEVIDSDHVIAVRAAIDFEDSVDQLRQAGKVCRYSKGTAKTEWRIAAERDGKVPTLLLG